MQFMEEHLQNTKLIWLFFLSLSGEPSCVFPQQPAFGGILIVHWWHISARIFIWNCHTSVGSWGRMSDLYLCFVSLFYSPLDKMWLLYLLFPLRERDVSRSRSLSLSLTHLWSVSLFFFVLVRVEITLWESSWETIVTVMFNVCCPTERGRSGDRRKENNN